MFLYKLEFIVAVLVTDFSRSCGCQNLFNFSVFFNNNKFPTTIVKALDV